MPIWPLWRAALECILSEWLEGGVLEARTLQMKQIIIRIKKDNSSNVNISFLILNSFEPRTSRRRSSLTIPVPAHAHSNNGTKWPFIPRKQFNSTYRLHSDFRPSNNIPQFYNTSGRFNNKIQASTWRNSARKGDSRDINRPAWVEEGMWPCSRPT